MHKLLVAIVSSTSSEPERSSRLTTEQSEQAEDHAATLTQAEKHQVTQVQQRAEQHEPEHRLAQQPHLLHSPTTQAEKTQAEKHQVAQVQQRAEQHEPEHRLAQQPHLLRSRATQAEKTQAEKHQAPAQLGPSGARSLLYTTEGFVPWCTTVHLQLSCVGP